MAIVISSRADADVDYLFVQVVVDKPLVDTTQNCGNILAGVGPVRDRAGLVKAKDGETRVRIHMVNSESLAVATVKTPGKEMCYDGDARIDGRAGHRRAGLHRLSRRRGLELRRAAADRATRATSSTASP